MLNNLPDIWGEGALFAFSESGLVASYSKNKYGLLLHTPKRRILDISLCDPGEVKTATGDVIMVDTSTGRLTVVFVNPHTITGKLPDNAHIHLHSEGCEDTINTSEPEKTDFIILKRKGNRFAVAYGKTSVQASQRALEGLNHNIEQAVCSRMEFYSKLPGIEDKNQERLLKKCASVMKVNTLARKGVFFSFWSTPDRVPHKDMWLWDSVFHSFAMNYLNPDISWDFINAVLNRALPDGMIPHRMCSDGRCSSITQPPILAWGVWENYLITKNTTRLEQALPVLRAYLEWNAKNRDQNNNGLLEWFIEGDELCRSGESGMDNSPRFDAAVLLDAVDFSTFQAHDMYYTGKIAGILGDKKMSDLWINRSSDLSQKIHHFLWDEKDGFYYDRNMDGSFCKIKAVSGFLPLLIDCLKRSMTRIISTLLSPCPVCQFRMTYGLRICGEDQHGSTTTT